VPALLDSDIASRLIPPQQCHCQHDSTVTSRHSQHRLDSAIAIASMTWQRHHNTVNIDSTTPLPPWLDSVITPRPTSTRQRHREHDLAVTLLHGQRRLGSATATLACPRRHQHDSGVWCVLLRLAIRFRSSPLIRLWGLWSTTPTDSLTRVHFYLHRRPRLEASASSPQCYGTLCQTS
jgi:hypothetical protein